MTEDRRIKGSDLRSYGRKRGRAPSARQKELWQSVLSRVTLPRDARSLQRPDDLFTPQVERVWLEIGFGGGEHLVWQAARNPQVGLIGCEPFEDGVVKVLSILETEGLTNIKIHADDARPLLRSMSANSIDRIFILFPDPWPKRRHHKRRLVSTDTVAELARIMRAGSELRIATDIAEYACAMLNVIVNHRDFDWMASCADDWRTRPADWPPTRYEAKAVRQGRKCYYFRFRRA